MSRLWAPARALATAAVAFAFAVLLPDPVRATPGQIHVIDREAVNLRAEPSTEAEIIGRLRRGDRVMEFERRDLWLRVRPMGRVGREGWVHGGLVTPEARAPVAPEGAEETAGAASPPTVVQVFIVEDDDDDRVIVNRAFLRKFRRFKRRNGSKDPEPAPKVVDPNRPRPRVPRSEMGGVGAGQWVKGGG